MGTHNHKKKLFKTPISIDQKHQISKLHFSFIMRFFSFPAFFFVTLLPFTFASPCTDNCAAADKIYESTCSFFPKETNEICHGMRTATLQRCDQQCATIDGLTSGEGLSFNPARVACITSCNSSANQLFVTYCNFYPLEVRIGCLETMKEWSNICFGHCSLL